MPPRSGPLCAAAQSHVTELRRRLSIIADRTDFLPPTSTKRKKRRVVHVKRQPVSAPIRLDVGYKSRTGWEPVRSGKENQDAFAVLIPFHTSSSDLSAIGRGSPRRDGLPSSPSVPDVEAGTTAFVGVFDGHGQYGQAVSFFVAHALTDALRASLVSGGVRVPDAIRKACAATARRLATDSDIDIRLSGSTASFILLHGVHLYCGNVGDSRCVLGRRTPPAIGASGHSALLDYPSLAGVGGHSATLPWPNASSSGGEPSRSATPGAAYTAIDLSTDHKPSVESERKRIVQNGGRVETWAGNGVGPYRVWLAHSRVPGLALSRAFGDDVVRSIGVNSEVELSAVRLGVDDAFVVVASDGLWEFMGSQEVVDLVGEMRDQGLGGQEVAEALVRKAAGLWADREDVVDDITVGVVVLQHGGGGGGSSGSARGRQGEPVVQLG